MSAITEKVALLGASIYDSNVPKEITLSPMPTKLEMNYVAGEDFEETMLKTVLPQCIEEQFDLDKLLEIDFQWIVRCLRIISYGPHQEVNTIFCDACGKVNRGSYLVNLENIGCLPLPEGFVNTITIPESEFIEFSGDIKIELPTIRKMITAYKDQAFKDIAGNANKELARICYMISEYKGQKNLSPLEIKVKLEQEMGPADYMILSQAVTDLSDYGLRAGGSCMCPSCGSPKGAFLSLVDDRFLRPSIRALRKWRDDKRKR